VKPLKNKEWAVCFLNRKRVSVALEFNWSENKLIDPDFDFKVDFSKEKFNLFNVWTGKQTGTTGVTLKTKLEGHNVLVFRLSH
jgi:alpha-galactosidase